MLLQKEHRECQSTITPPETKTYQSRFLYVAFQLNDICEQTSDEDIREVLKHLPKDLPETFERALSRISRSGPGKVKMAEKIFRWVAAAKRPLYIEELHEAIAIGPCQPFFMTEKLINDIDRIVPLCGGLITLDEEEHVVQFAHHSVKKFLLSDFSSALPNNFRFQLSQAEHEAGEICVTYLNFNDFKRQVAKVSSPRPPFDPRAILGATLSSVPDSRFSSSWSRLERLWRSRRDNKFDTLNHLSHIASENHITSFRQLSFRYVFLAYASEYWLSHTVGFEEHNTSTWSLWKHLLATNDPLAQAPWTSDDWTGRTRALAQYIVEKNHCALLRLIEGSKPKDFPLTEKRYVLRRASVLGYVGLLDLLLEPLRESGSLSDDNLIVGLFGAVRSGHSESVRRLLKAGVDVTASYTHDDTKSVHEVVERLEKLQLLLETQDDTWSHLWTCFRTQSARDDEGLRPLHLAALYGHLSVIQILLEHGSEIEARTQHDLDTALHLAARQGHESAVQALLVAGADIGSTNGKVMTALHSAARHGHGSVVQMLLKHGANVMAKTYLGRSSLHLAAEEGHMPVIHVLLEAGADVETKDRGGHTALHWAAFGGHAGTLQLLITSGANLETKDVYGNTVLYLAALRGDLIALHWLIACGADTETKDANGYTALHWAIFSGDITMTQLLLSRGADVNAKDVRKALDLANSIEDTQARNETIKLLKTHQPR